MKKVVLAAALLAAASAVTASAADRDCYSPADIEAEQALLFQTNLMVISSACRDAVYGEFRARNTAAILRYQNAMIDHFSPHRSSEPEERLRCLANQPRQRGCAQASNHSDRAILPAIDRDAEAGQHARC